MSIKIVWKNNLFCPVVFCDQCGEAIIEAKSGNFEWEMTADGEIKTGQIYFTHKQCYLEFEKSRGGRWGCDELRILPIYLLSNLGIGSNLVKKIAKLLDI